MSRPAADPVAPSTARLLRTDLARLQVDGRLPSLVACLVRDGEVCWSEGYGAVPGDAEHTAYRIGSITKTVTAVALLRLAAAGELSLDDPVRRWWPRSPYGEVTLRALLGHGAGVPAEPAGPWWERAGRGEDELALAAAEAGREAPHAPGRTFHYSNLGYGVLGVVLARATGEPWFEHVRDAVLAPLGMTSTTYDAPPGAARGWSVHPFARTLLPEPTHDTGVMAPAGQLWSTTGDLARWATFLLTGHVDVLAGPALRAAFEPQVGHGAGGPGSRHGLGFQLLDGGARGLVGHSGSMPGFVASCFVDPARGTGAVLLANATSGLAAGPAAARLLATLEAAEPTLPPAWAPVDRVPGPLAPLLGVWHWGPRTSTWALETAPDGTEEVVAAEAGRVLHRFRVRGARVVATEGYFTGEEVLVRTAPDGTAYLDLGTHQLTREPYTPGDVVPGGTPSV